jgi:Ca2+/Na+ antiporter
MKYFFWLSAAAYVVLYFYTAYIYEGFSMTLAIVLFVVFVAFLYWRHKRNEANKKQQAQMNIQHSHEEVPPLSVWQSPLPYVALLAAIVLLVGFQL